MAPDTRTVRAVTEYLTVLPDGDAPGCFEVVSQSGSAYTVDPDTGTCDCPDHEYRDVRCKHLRRVTVVTGREAIPGAVDPGEVDPHLGEHVDGTARVAVTDGGQTVTESGVERAHAGEECEECDALGGFPCWPGVRDGRRDVPGAGSD